MNNVEVSFWSRLGNVLWPPLKGFSALTDLALSRRGLMVFFLLAATGLAVAGWVRPPLSPDLHGLHITLEPSPAPSAVSEDLYGPRKMLLDSVGAFLLALLAAGSLLAWVCPQRPGLVAGLMLCGAVCANAAVLFNHPFLIELLDLEQEQRKQMARLLNVSDQMIKQFSEEPFVADAANTRVYTSDPADVDLTQGDLFHGYRYLLAGPWLVLLAITGVLLAIRGSLRRRLGYLLLWVLLAVGLACGVCYQRLWAEYHWFLATYQEGERDYLGSRRHLEEAVAIFPELGHLQRTWLLEGKLDRLEEKATPQSVFFTAYLLSHTAEMERGLALLEDLRAAGADRHAAVRIQAARAFTAIGVEYYRQTRFVAAHDAWRKAFHMVSENHDCLLGVGIVQGLADRSHPERIEAELAKLAQLADRPLRADVLTFLGHVYFEAGRFTEARTRYAGSSDSFSLPKRINYGAQKGLGGL